MFASAFKGKRVFVTGHTGFKGSWLCEWLTLQGASVTGYSDCVSSPLSHFSILGLADRLTHIIGDVRDKNSLQTALQEADPDFVFHLAAQPIVRRSYEAPIETFETNVMGAVHLLDVIRRLNKPLSCVIVTSDKCYINREVFTGYREDDALGGHDPYSASKAAVELAVESYRRSYFSGTNNKVHIATARAGNVIGGGDWSQDRIVPDAIRSLTEGTPIKVRNPSATRPWQHVLEPLSGYLWLATLLAGHQLAPNITSPKVACEAFNFGPMPGTNRSVQALVEEILKSWPGRWESRLNSDNLHEAGLLSLTIDKALNKLNWAPVLDFEHSIAWTTLWYREVAENKISAQKKTRSDILKFVQLAKSNGIAWACATKNTCTDSKGIANDQWR